MDARRRGSVVRGQARPNEAVIASGSGSVCQIPETFCPTAIAQRRLEPLPRALIIAGRDVRGTGVTDPASSAWRVFVAKDWAVPVAHDDCEMWLPFPLCSRFVFSSFRAFVIRPGPPRQDAHRFLPGFTEVERESTKERKHESILRPWGQTFLVLFLGV
jgi:hypothetical protein